MPDIKDHLTDASAPILYREVMSDMRALRDVEMKFVPFFFQIAAFVVTANIALMLQTASAPRSLVVGVGLLSVAFTLVFAAILIWKIGRDHRTHAWLGLRAQAMWRYLNASQFFCETNYGSGKGYKTNQSLILVCALFVILTIGVGLSVKFFCR